MHKIDRPLLDRPLSSAQMYLTFKDVQQDVYRVHTDGVVLSKKVDLPLGHGVGEWKVEKEGPCEVVNANVVEWE